jgi:aryl-alcohol dehydrogenase-like predicted oxidoreductase
MLFGDDTSPEEADKIVNRSLDAGINFIDTANVYVRGRSEEVLGDILKRNGKRESVVLATKVFGTMDDDDPNMQGCSRRHIIQQCDRSLQRLQTDWIDLYQIHRPDSQVAIDETLEALDQLIRWGKVNYIGTSTYAAWQLVESLWVSEKRALNRFVCEQPPYHLLDRRIERELIPMAQTYGFGLIPWSPLAGGFLTGKYSRQGDQPDNARYSDAQGRGQHLLSEENFKVLDVVEALAKEKGCTVTQVALAWCKDQPAITSPIIGPRTMDQLEDNLGAVDVEITDEDRKRLDEVAPPGTNTTPYYEADFGPHPHRV